MILFPVADKLPPTTAVSPGCSSWGRLGSTLSILEKWYLHVGPVFHPVWMACGHKCTMFCLPVSTVISSSGQQQRPSWTALGSLWYYNLMCFNSLDAHESGHSSYSFLHKLCVCRLWFFHLTLRYCFGSAAELSFFIDKEWTMRVFTDCTFISVLAS